MSSPPPEALALAEARADARAARDYARSDQLRDQLAEAGWLVRDGPDGWSLSPRLAQPGHPDDSAAVGGAGADAAPPYLRVPTVGDLPDRSGEPDGRRCTVGVLVDGWADDLRTCVAALLEWAPPDVVVQLLDNGSDAGPAVHELAAQHPSRVEALHLARATGWGAARTAMLRADAAAVHVLLDPSSVLEGDALTPLLDCLQDRAVVAAGWRGVRVRDDWTEFEDAGTGPVEALLGYLLAVRRSAAAQVPPPPATSYRNADLEWSFLLREAGGRLVVPDQPLPVRQDRHRGYHDSDPQVLARESRKTYARFLRRFRGREDLRLPDQP